MIGHWILGLAFLGWTSPQGQGPADALAEYYARRAAIDHTAEAHWKLGLWAETAGLKGEAAIEFLDVTRLEPARELAWKKLGFERRGGRWVSSEQLAAEKAEAEARRKADARWMPILRKLKGMLSQKSRRAAAEADLAEIHDFRAIPSIRKVFGQGTPDDQERAIDLLGRIEGEDASKALAGLGVFGKTDLVRRSAVETLTRRDPDDVLMLWIGLLRKPVQYEVRQVAGPGSPGFLMVEGEKFNVRRSYAPPSMSETQAAFVDNPFAERLSMALQFNSDHVTAPPPGSKLVGWNKEHGSLFIFDYTWAPPTPPKNSPDPSPQYQSFEKSVLQAQIDRDFEVTETIKMAQGAQAQLQNDVNVIEAGNATTRELNARLAEALRRVAGKDLGEDKEAWLKWYMERRGYNYVPPDQRPKPTLDVQVPLPYVPQGGPPVISGGGGGGGGAGSPWCMIWERDKGEKPKTDRCFAGGTLVETVEGLRPIEALRPGELVMTGDGPDLPDRPGSILAVHRSEASRMIGLRIGGETIVATEGHPLWKLGVGLIRAGDLKVGDRVFAKGGLRTIETIEDREGGEVWNLEIREGSTYRVGRVGLIVHDF
ncbi:polymorphic toxin-type HINT domain-containing protein [Tundrisphaera lichenicola]|uniref:polymorphic toxin-type HINT domain-containing protein n=1 Tax=Tundrisphaera lichenicola TaxID=2029860 RepID=UPI003EB91639